MVDYRVDPKMMFYVTDITLLRSVKCMRCSPDPTQLGVVSCDTGEGGILSTSGSVTAALSELIFTRHCQFYSCVSVFKLVQAGSRLVHGVTVRDYYVI